jgi:hypothetical protein
MSLSAIGRSRKANLLELQTPYSPPVKLCQPCRGRFVIQPPAPVSRTRAWDSRFTWNLASQHVGRAIQRLLVSVRQYASPSLAVAFVGAFGSSCRPVLILLLILS